MRIFLPQDTDFSSNGEKAVNPFSCIEHRESTAWYVLAKFGLEDVDLLKQDYILIVETKEKGNQPFRIHNIEVGSFIHVTAHHIGYDTKHYAVELSTVLNGNANACLVELKSNITPSVTPFVFSSNVTTLKSFSVIDVSLYEALTQIASEYNAYLDFDGWNVYILDSMGQDRGINIEYGKNLESAQVTEDWELVVTKLKPIGNNGLTLTPEWLTADISYAKPYTKIMQFDTDSVENLALVAQLYLDRYKYPRINYSVQSSLASDGIATISVNTHGQLEAYTHEQLAEFTHAQLESNSKSAYFGLGDTIYVKARQFTVLTDVISYDYNVLTKYVVGIEFGNYRPTVKNFFNEMLSNVEEKTAKRVQVKIDQLNGDFTIVANNYNNGLLSGTYYNFDGDAFTITNSLDEVVFSADALGNLTLTGTITGSNIIGSVIKSSNNADRIEFNNTTLQAFKNNYSRVELNYETMKFKTETGTDAVILKAYVNSASEDFKIMTKDNYKDYAYLYLGEATWGNTRQASIGVADDSLKYAICSSSVDDYNGASSYLVANNNAGTEATISCKSNGLLSMWSTTENYQIYINGALRGITRDANGFLKAV